MREGALRRIRDWFGDREDPLAVAMRGACAAVSTGEPALLLDRIALRAGASALGPELGAILEDAARVAGTGDVLQLGAGTGEAALRLAGALTASKGRLWMVEPAAERCRSVREMLEHGGLAEGLETLPYAPLDAIPSLHRQFDLILLHHAPELFLPDLRHAERHGVLRAGTHVIAISPDPAAPPDAFLAHVRNSGLYESHAEGRIEISRCLAEIEAW